MRLAFFVFMPIECVLHQLQFKPARRRMFTLLENMLFCEKWTRSFELESVLSRSFFPLLSKHAIIGRRRDVAAWTFRRQIDLHTLHPYFPAS
jgi:hypothetical protein